jgi:hypothetical protein
VGIATRAHGCEEEKCASVAHRPGEQMRPNEYPGSIVWHIYTYTFKKNAAGAARARGLRGSTL